MDRQLREAERYGGDLNLQIRRAGLINHYPKNREEFPRCPKTGCTHNPGGWLICDTNKCYRWNAVCGYCLPEQPRQHEACPGKYMRETISPCLCPCHITSYAEWLDRFMERYGPETQLPYAGMV